MPVGAFATRPENDVPFWYMHQLLSLVVLDWPTHDSFFYDIEGETNILTPERRANIMRHPERYFLVSADLHC